MKTATALLAAMSALALTTPAHAGTYLFDVTVSGLAGSGSLTTAGDASAGFTLITSLSGTFNGQTMNLLAPGAFPFEPTETNDNLFREAPLNFTFFGMSFSADSRNYNIWANGPALSACVGTARSVEDCYVPATFSARAAVPEPATWAMLILGFAAIGGALRAGRRQKVSVTYA